MKTKTNHITKNIKRSLLALLAVVTVSSGLLGSPSASAQTGCSTTTNPATTFGRVTQTVTVTTAGTYRIWSRIKAPNTTANSYYLQIGANTCAINVGDAAIAANAWTWVNYQAGATTNVVNVNLTAGTHTLIYTGKEADVQLDRVLLVNSDTSCTPTDTGDNCANLDAVNPTVSLSAPAGGTSVVSGTPLTISATAADNVGVSKVEFYVDGAMVNSDATAPYSYSWPTNGVAAGSHSLSARAYDAAGNTATSAAVNITLTASAQDTVQPTVSLIAPVAGQSLQVGATVTISANATDNVGVTRVEFYNGSTLLNTDTTNPYSYAWNTTGQTSGAKSLTAKAFDAAGNSRTSAAVSVTLTGGSSQTPGDVNGDGRVNAIDLSALISHDGQNYPAADFNGDGVVGAADLAILLNRWTW